MDIYSSRYSVPKMDCPSEEQLIRIQLAGVSGIVAIEFDLTDRTATVFHEAQETDVITKRLQALNLGANLLDTRQSEGPHTSQSAVSQRKTLWLLLGINAVMFILEFTLG